MPRLILILTCLLVLLAVPAVASAAPAKIRSATPVTGAGTTTVSVANPNAYALTGRATLTAAGRTVAKRVRLPRHSVTAVKLRLPAKALAALRPAGAQRAVVALRVSRSGRRASTVRRTFTLRPAAAPPAPPAPADGAVPAAPTPAPPAAASNRWVGRMGDEGGHDDLEFTLDNGQMTFTKAPAVPVFCFETPTTSNTWTSGELFDAAGPWTVGTDGAIDKQGVSVNPLVGRSPRTMTYKVTGTTQQAGKITGTLGMIFYAARPDVFTGALTIVNCAGSQSFEAVPAT